MKKLFTITLLMSLNILLFGQWSVDPAINTVVNDLSGEQAVPHIAYDANGNFYVGFYSSESGNYNIRLQYYNYGGVAQWASGGILVSSNSQNSWITEWELTTDNLGNCVMAFNDVRNGNADVFAYAISPTGTFLWGDNGLTLTTDSQDEFVPSITVTSLNNVIVAWSRPTATQSEIVMQKITPAGVLSWGASGIVYQTGSENYTGARVLGVENDQYLMAFYKETGNFPGLTRHIYVQKFNSTGATVWTDDVLASNSNGINAFNNFNIASDDDDGIIICWTDDRDSDNNIDAAAQRVLSDGTIDWPSNGVELTTESNTSNQNPQIMGVDNNDAVMMCWSKYNGAQSQRAIAAQKISSSGTKEWTSNGVELVAMSADVAGVIGGVVSEGTNGIISYEEYVSGSSVNTHISALGIDNTGTLNWSPTYTLMASRSTEKVHAVSSTIYSEQMIVVWEEGSASDIYMQNIYDDGSIGYPPISDDASLSDLTVNDITVDGFSPDIYTYSVPIPAEDPLPITGATANHAMATVVITQTTVVPGAATVDITAEDGITQLTYTVNFTIANIDATLSDLTVNDVTIPGFDPNIFNYDYTVPTGDPIPVVGATANDDNATVDISQATELPGTANVEVTAEDGLTVNYYIINFLYTANDDATLIDIMVDNVIIPDFDPDVYDYTYGVIFEEGPPFVDATANDPLAEVDITQAAEIPGDAVIIVTAEDGITILTYTVSFYYMDYDATLSDLTVDGTTIADFDPQVISYQYLVDDATTIPIVDGITTDPDASLDITQATEIPGEAYLHVIAEDGFHQETYTVHFYTLSSDATLSDLTADDVTIDGFDPLVQYYEVDLNEGQSIPFVDGTPNSGLATKVVNQAIEVPGDATIIVTAEDELTELTYTVHFNLITSIDDEEAINIHLYPNPTNDVIHLVGIDFRDIEIVSIYGELVFSGNMSSNKTIDISDLKAGSYFVRIISADNTIRTLKFLKK